MAKYLKHLNGKLVESNTVSTSAGAADADKPISLNASGLIDDTMLNLEATGGASADAGKIPTLDGTGKIPSTMMPSGTGAEVVTITASEALAAGDLVNIYDNSGTPAVRKADASTSGKESHGFVLAVVASGASATVYMEGADDQVTGQTAGPVYLSATTPGLATATPPSASGQVVQRVGIATSATSLSFSAGIPIVLA